MNNRYANISVDYRQQKLFRNTLSNHPFKFKVKIERKIISVEHWNRLFHLWYFHEVQNDFSFKIILRIEQMVTTLFNRQLFLQRQIRVSYSYWTRKSTKVFLSLSSLLNPWMYLLLRQIQNSVQRIHLVQRCCHSGKWTHRRKFKVQIIFMSSSMNEWFETTTVWFRATVWAMNTTIGSSLNESTPELSVK